jgi:hypothetical protein
VILDGIRITSPLRTAFELLRTPPLPDAVAAVDAMLHHRLVSLEDLVSYVERRPRWRGVRLAQRALPLLDAAAESPMESRLRLIWVLGGASATARERSAVRHPHRCIARSTRSAGRGGGRRCRVRRRTSPRSRAASRRQCSRAQAGGSGLIVIRFDGHDTLVTQARTLEAMRSAHRRGLQRDHRHDRWSTTWTPWWE